jgi:hypothetical protein
MIFCGFPQVERRLPGPHQARQGRGYQATVGDFCQIGANRQLTNPAILIRSNVCKRRPVTQLIRNGGGTLGGGGGDHRSGFPDCHPDPEPCRPHRVRPAQITGAGRFRWRCDAMPRKYVRYDPKLDTSEFRAALDKTRRLACREGANWDRVQAIERH